MHEASKEGLQSVVFIESLSQVPVAFVFVSLSRLNTAEHTVSAAFDEPSFKKNGSVFPDHFKMDS